MCVCTVPVVFEEDTKKEKYVRMWQTAKSTHGSPMGWMGSLKKVYAKRPSWKECEEYAHRKYTIPQTVKYYERDGHDNVTWEYENG